ICERRDQGNVTFVERPDDPSCEYHDANCDAFTHKRNAQRGSVAAPLLCLEKRVFRIGKNVRNMDRACLKQRAGRNRAAPRLDGLFFQVLYPFGYVPAAGSTTIRITLSQKDK